NFEKVYFSPDLNNRERACFETGIKLGALYHIISGIPIRSDDKIISSIEKGIEAAISCQPYVESVMVILDKDKILENKDSPFNYDEITGKIVRAELILRYKDIEVLAKVDWIEELQYPLMFIEKIAKVE
ncbi:MAG: dihydroneopterin aldolase family protein, partial [Candidatus Hodarchaeales archaeon]